MLIITDFAGGKIKSRTPCLGMCHTSTLASFMLFWSLDTVLSFLVLRGCEDVFSFFAGLSQEEAGRKEGKG